MLRRSATDQPVLARKHVANDCSARLRKNRDKSPMSMSSHCDEYCTPGDMPPCLGKRRYSNQHQGPHPHSATATSTGSLKTIHASEISATFLARAVRLSRPSRTIAPPANLWAAERRLKSGIQSESSLLPTVFGNLQPPNARFVSTFAVVVPMLIINGSCDGRTSKATRPISYCCKTEPYFAHTAWASSNFISVSVLA